MQFAEQQRADLRSANAKVQGLEAALAQLRNPLGRESEIKAQQAAGVVADVLARPGETMPAGGPVVSLLPPENIFVRFFVPEQLLAKVHERVKLLCDSCPADLIATVSFISPQAEYTPPVIYSETSRAKLVYRIEARPPAQQAPLLNPGQPVAVRLKDGPE